MPVQFISYEEGEVSKAEASPSYAHIGFVSYEEGEEIKAEISPPYVQTPIPACNDVFPFNVWFLAWPGPQKAIEEGAMKLDHRLYSTVVKEGLKESDFGERLLPPDIGPLNVLTSALPLEIREKIYEFVMAKEFRTIDLTKEIRRLSNPPGLGPEWAKAHLPAICLASEALYREASRVFIRNCVWYARPHQDDYLGGFLKSIPGGFDAVRALEFGHLDWYRVGSSEVSAKDNNATGLLKSCRNLQQIKFSVQLQAPNARLGTYTSLLGVEDMTSEEIVAKAVEYYDLEGLLKLRNLKKVTVCVRRSHSPCYDRPIMYLFEGLNRWFREQFSKGNKLVDLEINWKADHM